MQEMAIICIEESGVIVVEGSVHCDWNVISVSEDQDTGT